MKIPSPSYIEERMGNLYAGESRVTVSSIVSAHNVHHYTPEEIHYSFPTVSLETIYGVLAYYYGHQQELDERFALEDVMADQWRQAQLNDSNHPANSVRQRIEEARKQERIGDETHSR